MPGPLPAEMKLRLHRDYSIKLMLAWETCCRSNKISTPRPPPPPLFPRVSVKEILTTSALGSGILFSYPELATIAGIQGVVVYALSSSLPLLIFAVLGPVIRRKTPEGFVLTAWTRQRYGTGAMLYLSFMTLVTLFLYMTAELSAIGQVVNALTNLDGLPVMIVQCVITTVYTCNVTLPLLQLQKKRKKKRKTQTKLTRSPSAKPSAVSASPS